MHSGIQNACPACGAACPPPELNLHLLKAHRSFTFRGVVRPIHETLALLLAALSSTEPDVEAWRAFETISAHECGPSADSFLATSLTESLKRLPTSQQEAIISALGRLLAQYCTSPGPVLQRLATNSDTMARRLAWSVAEHAPHLLTREIVDGLLGGMRPHRAIDNLRRMQERIGPHPVIQKSLLEQEGSIPMRCPRCGAEWRRPDMIKHLWTAHGFVLDGRRVREPWEVIDDWIGHYRRGHDETLLERARVLAERSDPPGGLLRVYRRFLATGLHQPDARAYLLAEADERRASLCPHCYALVPIPDQVPPAMMSLAHGRLSARGYRVEIRETGVFPYLEIATPETSESRLPLPGPRLTRQGILWFLVGPLVAAAFLAAVLPLHLGVSPLVPVLTFLLPAVIFAVWTHWIGLRTADRSNRAVGHAWTKLVPALHADGFSLADSTFVAGLAVESIGRPGSAARARALGEVLGLTEKAVAGHPEALHHLAALRSLVIADAVGTGADPVAMTATQVARCFAGKLALPYGDKLLALWRREWRTRSNLARMRVLLLDRAFEAGLEVRDLLEIAQTAPELGKILGAGDPSEMARLRLLWSLRPRRPWDRCGEAETAFTLAGTTVGGQILGKHPDLLLYQAGSGSQTRADRLEVIVSGGGVIIGGKLFTEPAPMIEVRRGIAAHLLVVGDERFTLAGDPDEAAAQIERWLRYYFHEFVPLVVEVYRWRSPHAASILRAWGSVPCPECRRPLLVRPGDVGLAVEE